MGLASAWGLIQIILFLSNGIIAIPRNFLRYSDINTRLKTICCSLTLEQDVKDTSKAEIIESLTKLKKMKGRCSKSLDEYINQVLNSIPEPFCNLPLLDLELSMTKEINKSTIISLQYSIMDNIQEYIVHHDKYKRLLREGVFVQRLISSIERGLDYLDEPGRKEPQNVWDKYIEYLYFLWYRKIQPKIYFVMGVITIIYGVYITIGECSLLIPSAREHLSPIGYLLSLTHTHFTVIIITAPSLCMFIAYTYYGLFNFRLARLYGLYPHKQTSPGWLVYSGLYTSKLAFPICYNYLLLVNMSNNDLNKPVFERVMGIIDLVSIMGDFQRFFPCILIVFLIMNWFNLYNKVMKALSLEDYAFIVDVSDFSNRAGLEMINAEKKRQDNKIKAGKRSIIRKNKTKVETKIIDEIKKSKEASKSKPKKQQKKVEKEKVKKSVSGDEPFVISMDFSNTSPLLEKKRKK